MRYASSLVWGAVERRLARVLGMQRDLVHELLVAARARDDGRLAPRCGAFLIATTRVSPLLVPRQLRERAIGSFVWWIFDAQLWQPDIALAYAGLPRGLVSS